MWGYIFMAAVAVFRLFQTAVEGRSMYIFGRLAECELQTVSSRHAFMIRAANFLPAFVRQVPASAGPS